MSKDYYKILGVDKNASPDEVKKAFFRLAQKHHPDKGGEHDKFKEINEAYQVLGDAQKRARYDQYGSDFEQAQARGGQAGGFEGFDGFSGFAEAMRGNRGAENFDFGDIFGDIFGFGGGAKKERKKRGRDMEIEMEIDFREAVFGAEKNISLDKFITCPHCKGAGNEPGSKFIICPHCKGSGQVVHIQNTILGQFKTATVCRECKGEGRKPEKICSRCKGEGRTREQKEFKIKIPAGINHGQVIKLSGMGEAGVKDGKAGDLFIHFIIRPDKEFERENDNIISLEHITFSQAALGAKVKVKTLDGEVWLKIPSGTPSGKIFKLENRGVPHLHGYSRGDQLVKIIVEIPEQLTKQQKRLLEELGKEGL